MRTSILAASLALMSFASAQNAIADLPKCAQKCLQPFANENGIAGCGAYDIKCICSSGGFLSNIGCCLKSECSAADQAAAIAFAGNICKTAGIVVPSEIPCEASGSTTVDSAAASSSVSSAISSATSVISEVISSTSASSESLASTLSSASSAETAATTTGAGAISSGASSAAAAATSAAPNGASLNAVGGSGVLGGLVAALALL